MLPCLSPRTIRIHLPQTLESSGNNPTNPSFDSGSKLGARRSPSEILTEWVADDILNGSTHFEIRSAVSLISRKVVKSPSIVMPQAVKHVMTGSGSSDPSTSSTCGQSSSANSNNSCRDICTKL